MGKSQSRRWGDRILEATAARGNSMRLIAFETRYGRKIVGGRFGDLIRTASNTEELNAPLENVSKSLVERAETEHEEAILKQRQDWNLL
jgi:hypothetical protein